MRGLIQVLLLLLAIESLSCSYEESTEDMLIHCNNYQIEMFNDNRTEHQCEKENFSEDLTYVITELETDYSRQSFWCFVFLKSDSVKLKFKLWFSHKNFMVDAVSFQSLKFSFR